MISALTLNKTYVRLLKVELDPTAPTNKAVELQLLVGVGQRGTPYDMIPIGKKLPLWLVGFPY